MDQELNSRSWNYFCTNPYNGHLFTPANQYSDKRLTCPSMMQANIQLKNSSQGGRGWSYSLHKHDAGAHNCSSVRSQNGLGSRDWQPDSGAGQGGLQYYLTASMRDTVPTASMRDTVGLLQEDPSHTYWGKGTTIWSTRSFGGTGKPTWYAIFTLI